MYGQREGRNPWCPLNEAERAAKGRGRGRGKGKRRGKGRGRGTGRGAGKGKGKRTVPVERPLHGLFDAAQMSYGEVDGRRWPHLKG